MTNQDREDERLDEEGIGAVIERVMELVGLLQGPKLDLDAPSSRIELGELDGIDLLGGCVGDDEAPAILEKPALGYLGLVAFRISASASLAAVLFCLLSREAGGHEPAPVGSVPTDVDGHVESLGGGLPEDLVEVDTHAIKTGEAAGKRLIQNASRASISAMASREK